MKSLSMNGLELNRVMMDTAAIARGIDNYVSPQDINHLLRLIYHKKMATPALCDVMMSFLLDNDDTITLPNGLPKHIRIAHKTGTLAYVRGDAGIVFTEKPFVIAVMVRGVPTPQAEKIISDIAQICYKYAGQ